MRPGKNLWQIIHLMEILMRNVISLPPTPKDWYLALHPHPPQRNHHAITTCSRNQTPPWPGNQRKGDGHQVQEHSDQCGGEEHENKHIIFWPGFQDFKSLAGKQASRIHCPYRPEHRSSGTSELSPQPANSISF